MWCNTGGFETIEVGTRLQNSKKFSMPMIVVELSTILTICKVQVGMKFPAKQTITGHTSKLLVHSPAISKYPSICSWFEVVKTLCRPTRAHFSLSC